MGEPFDDMVGDCPAMRQVFATIQKLGPSDLTVLVLGETGTGKELVARSLHRRSRRAAGPFVALNCAALPASLLESELFGFEKGSFTGAVAAHVGHIERGHGGTLFLDEVAEMPLGAQAKLLRVVQDRRVQRLGSSRDRLVDVRLVAATHQDLAALVEGHAFRRDLYHRLNEAQIVLPPLRDRGGDLEAIAAVCLARLGRDLGRPLRLAPAAQSALGDRAWPGNVRELENALRAAALRAGTGVIGPEHLQPERAAPPRTLQQVLDAATEAALRQSLRRHAGDAAAAALELALDAAEFCRLAERLHVPLS